MSSRLSGLGPVGPVKSPRPEAPPRIPPAPLNPSPELEPRPNILLALLSPSVSEEDDDDDDGRPALRPPPLQHGLREAAILVP